jgi:hypothetical protein
MLYTFGNAVEQNESLDIDGGNINYYSMNVCKKIKIEILYDPAISCLGIYLKEMEKYGKENVVCVEHGIL